MDPPPPSSHTVPLGVFVEENPSSHATVLGDPSSSVWDWSDFLDFSIDEQLNFSLDSDQPLPEPNLSPIAPNSDLSNEVGGGPSEDPVNKISASVMADNRVRKRDPRLVCSNFLAGRIPCECPELDEKMEEEEGLPGKKRARTLRATAATLRCQVPECEADISKLKGYHRRHRVCLRCANASNVMLDGKRKRYCQQCGKFHILSDFDEGKRSCRRKLERHNNRRRRKASESCIAVEREPHRLDFPDDIACDDKIGKDSISLGSQIAEQGPFSEYGEGQISTHCSNPDSQIVIQNDSVVSFVASGEVQIDGERDDSKHAHSSPCDNKSTYSSTCPTGRISFKLYDWNPAEFPRRLRHQIFQWLASMPVELEGYIRPGCTILTVFISMPNFMWLKLHEDPTAHIRDLIAASGMMLYGRDPILVYVENMIFRLKRDGTSVLPVKVQEQAPKLHYVLPRCFEAGKPMEFVACGSNMLQPKFRFLVSFAGKYLAYGSCVPPRCDDTEQVTANSAHQLLRIQIPHTEPDLFGPAFVEVENESGISNFIPILIGDEEICSEMKIMEHRFESSLSAEISILMATGSSDSSNVSVMRQTAFSQLILDTAWLLRKSALEDIKHDLSSTQINRFNRLLTFLLENKSTTILERVLHYMESVMNNLKFNNLDDGDFGILQRNMNQARKIICEKVQKKLDSVQISCNSVQERGFVCRHSQIKMMSASFLNQDMGTTERGTMGSLSELNSEDYSGYIPLLNREVTKSNLPLLTKVSRNSCSPMFKNKYLASRPLIFTIAVSAVCFGICVVAFHPENAGKITTTIRSCLFDDTS